VCDVLAPIRGHDSTALLPAVLERVQTQVGDVGGLVVPVDAEYAALVVEVIGLPLFTKTLGIGDQMGPRKVDLEGLDREEVQPSW
jgi:hypothetical protein